MTLPSEQPFHVVAYFPEWGADRGYHVRNIDASGAAGKITLINYAFAAPGPDPRSGDVICRLKDSEAAFQRRLTAEQSVIGKADEETQPLRGHFNQLQKLKEKHPHLKVVPSLGGWTDSTWFSTAARTPESREKFVASCIDLFIHGNLPWNKGEKTGGEGVAAGIFDGIDIDWEFPLRGGLPDMHVHPEDDRNFVFLLNEFRRQFKDLGRDDLLLTAAVPGAGNAGNFRMQEAHELLDLVALMTYDFRGDWSKTTGHHTNLHPSADDPTPESEQVSARASVRMYRDTFGVPPNKLLLGAAFYGRGWKGVSRENNGLFQVCQPLGGAGGYLNYRNLVDMMQHGYHSHWDESARAPWLYNPEKREFITYDDPRSIAAKAEYVKDEGLGGMMFWEISGDDDKTSLLTAIHDTLRKG